MAAAFESEHLIYRAVEESDDPFILSLHLDAESQLQATARLPVPQGKNSAKEHRQRFGDCLMAAIICSPPSIPWAATEHMTPIGTITLSDSPNKRHCRNTELAISIARPYRSKGYGSEAIRWALDWAFRRAGLHKVCIWCYEFNTGAMKLYEKLGFVPEARLREHIWHDGRFWDECGYAILEREWKQKYGNMRSLPAITAPAERRNSAYTSPYGQQNLFIPTFRPTNIPSTIEPNGHPPTQLATPISATAAKPVPQSQLTAQSPASQTQLAAQSPVSQSQLTAQSPVSQSQLTAQSPVQPPLEMLPPKIASPEALASLGMRRSSQSVGPIVNFEYTTLKDSTVTVADLWKEWYEGFPDEGRPSVEWMEETHKGNWRKKQFGAPGASCQYFSQRKRIIDEIKLMVERGESDTHEAAIAELDDRMKREGMQSLNKLANELKKVFGVQKRRRYT